MSLVYGVDSKTPANTKLTNGYTLYDWVMRKSCFPSFWARNISGEDSLKPTEIEFLMEKNCKIGCIFDDLKEEIISTRNGKDDAARAIEAAKNLGIPQNKGIAIFADIPSDWAVNHNWMMPFAKLILANGYIPGFIGNTDSSKNFNFDRECSHYIQGTKGAHELYAVYWAKEPKYNFNPEVWAPYAPSEILPKDIKLWQYGDIAFHNITVNKSYMRNADFMKFFWQGEKT